MRSFEVVDSRILVEVDCGNRQVHDAFWLRVGIAGLPHARGAAYVVYIEPGSPDYAVILGLDILVHYDITISGGKCTLTAPTPSH